MKKSLDTNRQSGFSEIKIFVPFEINENKNIIKNQRELGPDKHYCNQLVHHLSRSNNHYLEERLNKLIWQKHQLGKLFRVTHRYQESPCQLIEFHDLYE